MQGSFCPERQAPSARNFCLTLNASIAIIRNVGRSGLRSQAFHPTSRSGTQTMTSYPRVRAPRRLHAILPAALLFLAATMAPPGWAQDSHYWNLSYGTYPTLLGGTVIGSPSDLSGSFYNPGFRPARKTGEILLTAQVYQYESLTLEGNLGNVIPLSGSSFAVSPNLVAGNFPGTDTSAVDRFTYSLLARQHATFDIEGRLTTGGTAKGNAKSGELVLHQKLSEYWAGFTWSRQLDEAWSAGVTTYIPFRSQNQRLALSVNSYADSSSVTSNMGYTNLIDYFNVRLLWKAGIGFMHDNFSAGMTVTTPSISIMGSGEYYLQEGIDDYPGEPTYFAASSQKDLTATYKSSWAVGAGLAYLFDDVKVYLSGEWYAPVSRYDILNTEDFTSASTGRPVSTNVVQELEPVFNYGAGIEIFPGRPWSYFASFVADHSNVDPYTENSVALTAWDLYHVAGGGVATFGRYRITLGASVAFGNGRARTLSELAGLITANTDFVTSSSYDGTYVRAQLIAALSVAL